MKKTSDRVAAARNKVIPAAEDFVQMAADRVGPLTQLAAERVGPLAGAAAERVGAAAAGVGPLAQSAAERVGPFAHSAAERVGPFAYSAAERVTPLAAAAAAAVGPFAHQAAEAVSPYTQLAAERLTPLADQAKQRGVRVAQDAVDRFGPALDDALERVGPAVDAARGKVSDELLPKLSAALSAAAASPVGSGTVDTDQATNAAARGDLVLPPEKSKARGLKRFAIVAAVAAVAYVLARRFLGSKDSDWQAARPTTPYTPPKPAAAPTGAADVSAAAGTTEAEAGDDPQGGRTTHSENLTANGAGEPGQPAEGGEPEADPVTDESGETVELPLTESADITTEPVDVVSAQPLEVVSDEPVQVVSDETESVETAGAGDPERYAGEGAYVGSEPPEGFTIKGNERSMKYHLPDSSGYVRTIAEVWFSSEEAAQAAGFVRAQR